MSPNIHESRLKSYLSYLTPHQYGINCRINYPTDCYPLHRHDYIEIEYLAKGKIEHELNGIKSLLSTGSCYGLGYHDLHRFTVVEPVEFYNICIFYRDAPYMIQKLLNSVKFPFTANISLEDLPIINKWFEELSNHINNHSIYSFEKITAYTLLILTYILEISTPLSEKPLSSVYEYIVKAVHYIDENLTHSLTLKEVSAYVNLSPNYFSKIFTEISGCTFISYLTQQRIDKAKSLLAVTNKSVTEIAFECGFGSFSSFSRAFKQICNCCPHEFRNITRNLKKKQKP